MALPITDLFNQNTGSSQAIATYSANWSVLEGGANIPTGNVSRYRTTSSGYNTCRNNTETFNADQYAKTKWIGAGGYFMGPAVRCQSGSNSSYHVDCDGSSYYISKCVSGAQTTIDGPISMSLAAGDWVRLEVEGTSLRVYKALAASPTSFSQVGSTYTDSAISAAGYGGIFGYDNTDGAGFGNGEWEAGNLGGGGASGNPWWYYQNQKAVMEGAGV